MKRNTLPTEFAPAERSTRQEINRQVACLDSLNDLQQFVKLIPDVALVVNRNRQIIFANDAALKFSGHNELEPVHGLCPGELVGCIHAFESKGGCGTTRFCSVCGGLKAALCGLRDQDAAEECQIAQKGGNALDLKVWSFPLRLNNEPFVFLIMTDISSEKRRRVLERIFFHDVMNILTGLEGWIQILRESNVNELDEVKDTLSTLSQRLIEEIKAQRELLAAENNELVVNPDSVDSLELLNEIAELYQKHEAAREKNIVVDSKARLLPITTDKVLLSRVLANMVKNALEASKPGDTVKLGCEQMGKNIQFWVHNPGFILPEVQLQIFQRSFSTKGGGRGLGTYSMRLLSERYLKGSVAFTTSEKDGTKFVARYPSKI